MRMKAIDLNSKKRREDLDLLQDHLREHSHDMKHAILIIYSSDEEMIVSRTRMAEIEYLGLLDFAKDLREQFDD